MFLPKNMTRRIGRPQTSRGRAAAGAVAGGCSTFAAYMRSDLAKAGPRQGRLRRKRGTAATATRHLHEPTVCVQPTGPAFLEPCNSIGAGNIDRAPSGKPPGLA